MVLRTLCLLTLLFIISCENNVIKTYKTPKEQLPLVQFSKETTKKLTWTIPTHWEPTPLGQFRKASYNIPLAEHVFGDFSITVFPGKSGSLLNNVNRWRNQLALDPTTEAELSNEITVLQVADISVNVLFLENNAQSIYVATFTFNNEQYFFKLTGQADLLLDVKNAFIGVINGITVE